MSHPLEFQGAKVWKGLLARAEQQALVNDLRTAAGSAPFRQYETPGGHKMSVRMTGAGDYAWTSSRSGYAYTAKQPNGEPWPAIPERLLEVWRNVTGLERLPDSCLINFYGEGAKMGLHQDADEADARWPVVSISLGDDAQFRVGGQNRRDPTKSIWLSSGDIVVLSGASRLAYNGIDKTKFGSSTLFERGGRLNVTLRIAR